MRDLLGKVLKLKEDVTLVSIEDQAAVLDVKNRCYYDPNETAFFILKLTEDGVSLDEMKTALLAQFDVSVEKGGADLDVFVEELFTLSLIEVRPAGVIRPAAGRSTGEKKAYQPPLVEHQTQIAVAAAVTSVSPAVNAKVPVPKPV